MNHEEHQRMLDTIKPGLTLAEKQTVRDCQKEIIQVMARMNPAPILAYIALLNVLGDLIAKFLISDINIRIAEAQQLLPLYVEAYRVGEKKI